MTLPNRPKSALLPGEFVNLGDAMLSLAGARRLAREGHRVAVLPYRQAPDEVRQEFQREGFEVIGIRDQPWRALRACMAASVWIGGGHAIRNDVSMGWLLFTALVSWLARLFGRSVRVIGSGVSAVKPGRKRWLFSRILAACDRICVRDPLSAQSIEADFPEVAGKLQLAADLAFLKGCLAFDAGRMDPLACLVSPGIDVREGRKEDPAEIVAVLRVLVERFGMKHVIVVPHDARPEYGLAFSREFEAAVRAALPVTVEVVAGGGIAQGLLEPYSRARWIITGRLHGLIVGANLGRSVIYTPGSAHKLRPFAELFGYKATACAGQDDAFHCASEVITAEIGRQQLAAELNFNPR